MDGEQWIDQRQRIADRAKFSSYGNGDGDQQRRFEQVRQGIGDGGDGVRPVDDLFRVGGVQSIDDCAQRDVAMQGNGAGDREL